ncbi:alpha/beta fold hydrolase [Streptomyces sp. YIM 98790]|uniref:alpha/beta fold hydrolase n=1 Tax=Streptomyces sp. YIM 98790 TaxID=2689077 RepID=UPI00140C8ECE|nr:alpha/beta hydrolase [Streptomyces sp. YIM 98790]
MDVLRRNHVRVTGRPDGPPLLLAHGFGCDQNMWRLVTPRLAPDFRILLFDYVGAGDSDLSAWREERYSSLEGYAQDIIEVLHALDPGPVVYVGHSVSAMTGVVAALREPELFSRLVLLTPSPRYLDDTGYRGGFSRQDIDELLESLESNYLGWSSRMAPVIMDTPDRPELQEELTNSFCRTDPAAARAFARATFLSDNRADLRQVTLPTLVIEAAHDSLAPREVGAYVRDAIPDSTLVTLDARGHCPHLSAPGATAAAIAAFAAPGAAA